MKKNTYRSVLTCLLLFLFIGMSVQGLFCQEARQTAIVKKMKEKDPKFKIRWNQKTGVPARIKGMMSKAIDAPPKGIAAQFFKENKNLFKMTDSEKELRQLRVKEDARKWNHVKFQQTYNSFKVEGRSLVVHIDAEKQVQVVNGHFVPNIDVDTTAEVELPNAINKVKEALAPKKRITEMPKSELVVYHFKGKTYFAWKVVLISRDPLGEFVYYVDAHTGKVVNKYNNLKIACIRKTYDAESQDELPGTLKRSEGDGPVVGDMDLNTAHDNMGTICNLYRTRFNRDSYDNAGAEIVTSVHFMNQYNNAFWSPDDQQFAFGDGDGTIFAHIPGAIDVVAHEFTHAVTENESNLVYEYESGALNESLSDIFALLADPGDWMIGEDCYTPGTPGDALRHMDDPPKEDQPDHMDDFVTPNPSGSEMDKMCYDPPYHDNGCVHFNSGIPNKAAYLMAEGGTHRGVTVAGMGLDNMLKLFYEVQDNDWLTETSDFMDAREATLDAVEVLFPGDTAKKETVKKAWDAVGVVEIIPKPIINLTPTRVEVEEDGATSTLKAKLIDSAGSPMQGKEISFSIPEADASIASVSPTSGNTDSDGIVNITVTGKNNGKTTLTATAEVDSQTITAEVKITVVETSAGTTIGLIFMLLLLGIIFVRYYKKEEAQSA